MRSFDFLRPAALFSKLAARVDIGHEAKVQPGFIAVKDLGLA